jgi:zinc transport system substrate-binding protein
MLVWVAVLAAATVLAAACGGGQEAAPLPRATKLSVVTTIYPVTYFAQRIGGDRVQVTTLVPAGVEAHDYEPKPSDLRSLRDAAVVVYNHPSFEAWIAAALKSLPEGRVIVQAASLEAGAGGTAPDPHVWLSPSSAALMVEKIKDGLAQADPAGVAVYESNALALTSQLVRLELSFVSGLTGCALNVAVVSHEAYWHLLAPLGVEQIGLSGLSAEAAEARPRTVAAIADRMRELGIKHVLVEPILSPELAEAMAAETGATLLPLHPLESLTPAEVSAGDDYFSVMARNLRSLKTALQCAG